MLYKVKLLRTLMLSSVMTMMMLLTLMTFDPGGSDNVVATGSNVTSHGGVWLENSVTKVVMEPNRCGEEDIVVIIHSHARNSQMRASQRNAMRQSGLVNIKPVFVVFRTDKDGELVKEMGEEGDLLLGDMEESYHHLVHKHLMGLRWAAENCQDNLVIKMDDDIFVNFRAILEAVQISATDTASGTWMAGLLQLRLPVQRSEASKWAVTWGEWPGAWWPDFLSGWCYIISSPGVRRLLSVLESDTRLLWIDDVMVTGILADKAGVERVSLNSAFTVYREEMKCCAENIKQRCRFLVGPTDHDPELLDKLVHQDVLCRGSQSCGVAPGPGNCRVENPYFMAGEVIGEVIPL